MSAQQQKAGPVDNRALLHTIGRRKVSAVANEVSDFAQALLNVVAERKPLNVGWTEGEWELVLQELDASDLTIAEFLQREYSRPKS